MAERESALGRTIRELREERGWSLARLSEELANRGVLVAGDTLGKAERGERRVRPNWIGPLASAFGLTRGEFDLLWRGGRVERTRGGNGIPVLNRVSAGVVVDYEEWGIDSGQGFEYIDSTNIADELAFALIVCGDSMAPHLRDGDYIVLTPMTVPKPAAVLEAGDIVFVRFTDDSQREGGFLAAWYPVDASRVRLVKTNPAYESLTVKREDIGQLAKVIERRVRRISVEPA